MLISEGYRAEQTALHAKGGYGTSSLLFGKLVSAIVNEEGLKTLLDYGCGSMQNLRTVLDCDVLYQGYDPAIPEFTSKAPAELVCCIDVLEHVEPELLGNVLADLWAMTRILGFFTVHTGPAMKTLSDGRNAHLIQKPPEWWLDKLSNYFSIEQFQEIPDGFFVVCERL